MPWTVEYADEFQSEFDALDAAVQDELRAHATLLAQFGPSLGRPRVDTLKGARHANLKELRFDASGGVWRVAFAFDPRRHGILLVAGDKSGGSEKLFYRRLIATADTRLDAHLQRLRRRTKSPEARRKK
ncbi:MAG: type II toxin-antitoxin system RelE/ParE family toxin [Steroidobacteraceae bacterium]